ncbi:glycosyltransferase [Winogradskyella sp.]|uniref:glycosyltransferase n=1 Tax=Winogradskyella sp. TaxID=1883156 RepID=UPI001B09D422|nr:glycosyltransferase [Winogradskyella sp.]MBO6881502.1 glycosyltransferase [Winogradskyella sp.]
MLKYQQFKITYVLPIYTQQENLEAFHHLLNTYQKYSEDIKRAIHFIFVDDCSPVPVTIPKDVTLNYTLVKVQDDIPWNQGGARNLGVHLAKTSKLILTDLDHTFSEEGLKQLIRRPQPEHFYVFRRINEEGEEVVSHYNTFFCNKSLYFKSLGVDECFAGNYGFEDIFFVDIQRRLGTKFLKFKSHPVHHMEHKNSDNPQHSLPRDMDINRKFYEAKRRVLKDKNRDPFDAHSRLFLNFEWQIKEESIRL